jgi:hypothetical protein
MMLMRMMIMMVFLIILMVLIMMMTSPSLPVNVQMMLFFEARERTDQQWEALLLRGGFRVTAWHESRTPFQCIEAEVMPEAEEPRTDKETVEGVVGGEPAR